MLNGLRKLQNKLAKIPSLFFIILYCALIPLFSCLYNLSPTEFYHSTIKYEKAYESDKEKILKDLKESIIKRFVDSKGNKLYKWDENWTLDISQTELKDLKATSIGVEFKMDVNMYLTSDPNQLTNRTLRIALPNPDVFLDIQPFKEKTCQKYIKYYPNIDNKEELEISLIKIIFAGVKMEDVPAPEGHTSYTITLTPDLYKRLNDFQEGSSGNPGYISNNFSRMLYFSVVTITTLGYGDIVPLTEKTRLLVGLESTLGVLVVGLFFNSLANQIKK